MRGRTPGSHVPLRGTLAIAAFVLAGCATRPPAPALRAVSSAIEWDYVVRAGPRWELDVTARFGPFSGNLGVEGAAAAFVDAVTVDGRATPRSGAEWPARCEAGCTVRYRFRLADAARALRDVELAIEAGGAVFAPPATWLLRPRTLPEVRREARYRFRVLMPAGADFVTGVRPVPGGGAFAAPIASFEESSFAGFGELGIAPLGDSGVTIAIPPAIIPGRPALVEWAEREVAAVDGYLGRGGDGHAVVFVVPGDADGTSGKTLGGGGVSAFIQLRQPLTERKLYEDWVLAHELIHARFPAVQRRHAWFSEGLATYVEPIARARAGLLDELTLWREVVQGMPQGLPRRPDDAGLDGNGEWGRVYWGGALFLLVADVQLRKTSGGAHSLQSALRAVIAKGGNAETMWPLERILKLADEATGTAVLRSLYERMGLAPGAVDLPRLWKDLGIVPDGEGIHFDETAPDAGIRRAIAASSEPGGGGRLASGQADSPPKSKK